MGNWKSLIFTDTGEDDTKKESKGEAVKSFQGKFPTSSVSDTKKETVSGFDIKSTPTFKTTSVTTDEISCEPHMEKIMGMYEKGFEDLNQDGYDFYEYYKAIVEAGLGNPVMYQMALTMAKSMDPNVSKSTLLEQAKFYVSEIVKVHEHYQKQGDNKRDKVLKMQTSEESTLTSELTNLDSEISKLSQLRDKKRVDLSRIDGKYASEMAEIQCKVMANDMAKNAILGSIEEVTNGIKNNIK